MAIQFDAPIRTELKVFVINDETGQRGEATLSIGWFESPTPDKIKESLLKMQDEQLGDGALAGFRLMTKAEAWDYFCMETAGQKLAMPGGDGWGYEK